MEAKFLPNQNPDVLVEEVLATARQLRLSKLAWRVASSPDSLELERALENAGFTSEKMDELLAWELSDGPAPILPELVISREVMAEQITIFEHYQAARRVEAAAFGHRMPSEAELEQEWSSATADPEGAAKFARFFSRIGNTAISTGGLALSDKVARLWGAAIAIVNARTGTSGPILKRMGFRVVSLTKEYELQTLR